MLFRVRCGRQSDLALILKPTLDHGTMDPLFSTGGSLSRGHVADRSAIYFLHQSVISALGLLGMASAAAASDTLRHRRAADTDRLPIDHDRTI